MQLYISTFVTKCVTTKLCMSQKYMCRYNWCQVYLSLLSCTVLTLCNLSPQGGHFHIMELRIRVNKNVEKGLDFCHRASSTFLEKRGQFSTTSTLRVSILNNEHRHLGSYFRPIRCCFRSPDFLGTDGRHLGMACRLLRYIVMIKRVTLVCKRDLRWKRLWYESEKLRGQLANFHRHSLRTHAPLTSTLLMCLHQR